MFHPRILGLDGRLKSKKEIEGLNKVLEEYKAFKKCCDKKSLFFSGDAGKKRS